MHPPSFPVPLSALPVVQTLKASSPYIRVLVPWSHGKCSINSSLFAAPTGSESWALFINGLASMDLLSHKISRTDPMDRFLVPLFADAEGCEARRLACVHWSGAGRDRRRKKRGKKKKSHSGSILARCIHGPTACNGVIVVLSHTRPPSAPLKSWLLPPPQTPAEQPCLLACLLAFLEKFRHAPPPQVKSVSGVSLAGSTGRVDWSTGGRKRTRED